MLTTTTCTSSLLLILIFGNLYIKSQGTELDCDDNHDGLFRIVSGQGSDTSQRRGRVEICIDPRHPSGGTIRDWYSVCSDSNWDEAAAAVVCEQLGFSETGAMAEEGSTLSTDESRRVECSVLGKTESQCDDTTCSQQTTVQCEPSQCRSGEIRLRGGSTDLEGRVEICYNQQWGTIRNNRWNREDANVACGQLGYSNQGTENVNNVHVFGRGTGPIHFTEFGCTGSEERLIDCVHSSDTGNSHNSDAGVRCMPAFCIDGEVRLVGGTLRVSRGRPLNGRVEVCVGQRWGSVCDDNWDAVDASVVCNQLGFQREGAIAIQQSVFGEPVNGLTVMFDVQCKGKETNLRECLHMSNRSTSCPLNETSGVICKMCSSGDIRLVNGSHEGEGRVEVCVNQQWSSVCDQSWSQNDAIVTCRQLGYSDDNAVNRPSGYFGEGEGTIFLTNLECTGVESSLFSCGGSDLRPCDHSMDVGVSCSSGQATRSQATTEQPTSQSALSDTILGAVIFAVLVVMFILVEVIIILVCLLLMRHRHRQRAPHRNNSSDVMTEDTELETNTVYGNKPFDASLETKDYETIPKNTPGANNIPQIITLETKVAYGHAGKATNATTYDYIDMDPNEGKTNTKEINFQTNIAYGNISQRDLVQ